MLLVFQYLARDLVIIFANVLHLYIHCIVADVARLLQSYNALFDGDCNIATVIVMAFGLVMYPYLPGCAVGVD